MVAKGNAVELLELFYAAAEVVFVEDLFDKGADEVILAGCD